MTIMSKIDNTAHIIESVVGLNTEIGARSCLTKVDLAPFSRIGTDTKIINTRIGKYCSIGDSTAIKAMPSCATSERRYFDGLEEEDDTPRNVVSAFVPVGHVTSIGHAAWIGRQATISPGVYVGVGAVVSPDSFVTSDVPDYAIVSGTPAQFRGYRFNAEVGFRLLQLGWWDWPHERVMSAFADFKRFPIEVFLTRYEKKKRSQCSSKIAQVIDLPTETHAQ